MIEEIIVASEVGGGGFAENWVETWNGHYGALCADGLAVDMPDSIHLNVTFSSTGQECSDIALVATDTGKNTAWTGRVSAGSSYTVPELNIDIGSDYKPFGGVVPPEPANIPSEWDAIPSVCVNPLVPNFTNNTPCFNDEKCTIEPYTKCGFVGKDPLLISPPNRLNTEEMLQGYSSRYAIFMSTRRRVSYRCVF